MRFALVAALVRLYPSAWRAEYGDEFALLLVRRPLGPLAILNVIASAIRQHVRVQPPWRILAAPLCLWMCVHLTLLFTASAVAARIGGNASGVAIASFVGVGFWTTWRSGAGGGKAALKLSIVLAAPLFLAACVNAALLSLSPPRAGTWGVDVTAGPFRCLPYAAILGWLGGGAATLLRRRLRSAH